MTITTKASPGQSGSRLLAALLAGLAVSLTACAGNSPAAPGAGAPAAGVAAAGAATSAGQASSAPSSAPAVAGAGVKSACALVTEQDASMALGTTAGPGTAATAPGGSRCVYDDGALIVNTDAQGKTAYDEGHAAIKKAPASRWADVPGLGDGGFVSHGGPVASVEFYKGSTLVAIILSGSGASAPVDAALTVARAAAARI